METTDHLGLIAGAARVVEEALARAESEEERNRVLSAIDEAFAGALRGGGTVLANELRHQSPRLLRTHRRERRRFERRLLKRWRKGLDALDVLYLAALEAGAEYNDRNRPEAAKENDPVFEALAGLHARACLVASEVSALLRTGHPAGALARWRTLHECAVISSVIGEHGRTPDTPDLANRYLLHDLVQNAKDARDYQEYCSRLGYEPLSETELADIGRQADVLASRYGSKYRDQYGWALPLFPGSGRVTFRDLEQLAQLDHLRPFYGLANHDIHADAKGVRLNQLEFRGSQTLLAGPSNAGLADPGQSTAISLLQATVALMVHGRPQITDTSDIPVLEALGRLTEDVCDTFIEAHEGLERDEEGIVRSMREGPESRIGRLLKHRSQ